MRLHLALAAMLPLLPAAAHAAVSTQPSHIVIVIGENQDASNVVGSATAPFINGTLIPNGLLMTNSHGIEHPSQPNYLDLFSGSNQGVTNGNATATNAYNFPAQYAALQSAIGSYQAALNAGTGGYSASGLATLQAHAAAIQPYVAYGTLATGDAFPSPQNFNIASAPPFTTPTMASALIAAGKTFRSYSEGLIAAGVADAKGNAVPSILNSSGDSLQVGYARRHDPVSNWISTTPTGNQLPVSADTDFSNFPKNFNDLPTVSFVVPDTINDGHDGGSSTGVGSFDSWLASNMATYAAWAKDNNSLLIVTFDENSFVTAGNGVTTIIDGAPGLVANGATSSQYLDHYGLLATILNEEGAACVAASCSATPIVTVNGQLVPEPTSLALLGGVVGLLGLARRVRA